MGEATVEQRRLQTADGDRVRIEKAQRREQRKHVRALRRSGPTGLLLHLATL